MNCLFCGTNRDKERVDKSAKAYLCGTCVQTLFNLSQEQLNHAHQLSVDKGYLDKVKAIKCFMEVEENEQAKDAERNMVRARPDQQASITRDQIRP